MFLPENLGMRIRAKSKLFGGFLHCKPKPHFLVVWPTLISDTIVQVAGWVITSQSEPLT